MAKKSSVSRTLPQRDKWKRGLTIPPAEWEAFTAFVKMLEIHQGSRTTHVTNSDAAMAAFRLFRCLGVDKARRPIFDTLHDEAWWSNVECMLKPLQWPEQ